MRRSTEKASAVGSAPWFNHGLSVTIWDDPLGDRDVILWGIGMGSGAVAEQVTEEVKVGSNAGAMDLSGIQTSGDAAYSRLHLESFQGTAQKPDSEQLKSTLESVPACYSLVRYDDANLYVGDRDRTVLNVVPVGRQENAFQLKAADSVVDTLRDGNALYILTQSGIEEWNLNDHSRTATYKTYNNVGKFGSEQQPQSFARYDDKLVIAHGRLGVSFFDLSSKTITNQFSLDQDQRPLESEATGITVDGKNAYVSMSNYTIVDVGTQAFRGIVKLDLEKEQIASKFNVLDPGADAVVNDGKSLLVSFGGDLIWKYALKDFSTAGHTPRVERRIYNFPDRGHPTGTPALDSKYYLSCYAQAPAHAGEHFKYVPKALDRKQIQLD